MPETAQGKTAQGKWRRWEQLLGPAGWDREAGHEDKDPGPKQAQLAPGSDPSVLGPRGRQPGAAHSPAPSPGPASGLGSSCPRRGGWPGAWSPSGTETRAPPVRRWSCSTRVGSCGPGHSFRCTAGVHRVRAPPAPHSPDDVTPKRQDRPPPPAAGGSRCHGNHVGNSTFCSNYRDTACLVGNTGREAPRGHPRERLRCFLPDQDTDRRTGGRQRGCEAGPRRGPPVSG